MVSTIWKYSKYYIKLLPRIKWIKALASAGTLFPKKPTQQTGRSHQETIWHRGSIKKGIRCRA